MTERKLATLLAFALLAGGCGSPPATPDASTADGGDEETDAGPPGCPAGTEMCGSGCVDTESSRAHCGACGTTCATGEACVGGECQIVCPGGQAQCGDVCSDTLTDRLHCGDCATACGAGELCVGGFCEVSCPAGQEVCGSTCVDTQSDPAHCGSCGAPCDAGEVCSEGACAASCGAGLTQCGAACVGTANDPMHCGGCDNACPSPDGGSGLCAAGACVAVCDALYGDCNADRTSPTGDGCETPLATDVDNCGACGHGCALADAIVGCDAGTCVIATCDVGFDDCDGSDANGCEVDVRSDSSNCGACGTICAATEVCFAGGCIAPAGDDCSEVVVLSPGHNTVPVTATMADYLVANPSCVSSSYTLEGPDVVMSYTATTVERVTFSLAKPSSERWVAVASTAACGTFAPTDACISNATDASLAGTMQLTAGQTVHFYVRDTSNGIAALSSPLEVDVTALDCAAPPPVVLNPANGGTLDRLMGRFQATFAAPVITTSGSVTVTRSTGPAVTYDLSMAPTQVTFDSSGTVMTIAPGVVFDQSETVTITWSGIRSVVCTTAVDVPSPTWQVTAPVPPCTPGMGGLVGTTMTRFPMNLGLTSITEWYVAADESPTGFVYFGGLNGTGAGTQLYQMRKSGGPLVNVYTAAGLTADNAGYGMFIDGPEIFLIDSDSSNTTGQVFRISTTGGASWAVQDYAAFPVVPGDDLRGGTVYGGRIYVVTDESTDTAATEIWSMEARATTLPVVPRLERTFEGNDCQGVARDASYFYVACGTGDRIVRVPVGTGPAELVTDYFDLNLNANALHGEDLNADGTFDVLYVGRGATDVGYVCNPGTSPYADTLVSFGTRAANYGLGFDRTAGVLWTLDDTTFDLISIQ